MHRINTNTLQYKFLLLLMLSVLKGFSQDYYTQEKQYEVGFQFEEGIYQSFTEFKNNQPGFTNELLKEGDKVFYNTDTDSLIQIDPNKVWGYSFEGNVYISNEGAFWRCINIGTLTHFAAVSISTYSTIDNFGFYNEVETRSLQQSFIDMNSGEVKPLTFKNLKPYINEEPPLANHVKNNKKVKFKELILVLKAYNKLNPLFIPIHE